MENHLTSTVELTRDGVTYVATYRDHQLIELTIRAEPVTATAVRRAPLTALHKAAADQDTRRPSPMDEVLMLVNPRASDFTEQVVRAFTVAELQDPDRATEIVADANGVHRTTAHRWRVKATTDGMFTREAVADARRFHSLARDWLDRLPTAGEQ